MGRVLLIIAAVFGVLTLVCVTALCRTCAKEHCGRIAQGELDEKLTSRTRHPKSAFAARVVGFVFAGLIATAALLSAVQTVAIRVSGGKMLLPYAALAVGSGSMSYVAEGYALPDGAVGGFDAYELVFIRRADEAELSAGDVIAFYNSEGTLIIHRITEVFRVAGQTFYNTRGDANTAADREAVGYSSVVGKYTGASVPYVGAAVMFLQSWVGLITLAAVVYIVCVYDFYARKISAAVRERLLAIDGEK
ncbi:MAG TPA: signal peptidase I [Candidatus Coproplasma excrementipullorum]|nr:signal peptidase I [Candidatus Coproplasma excrementipullorum]